MRTRSALQAFAVTLTALAAPASDGQEVAPTTHPGVFWPAIPEVDGPTRVRPALPLVADVEGVLYLPVYHLDEDRRRWNEDRRIGVVSSHDRGVSWRTVFTTPGDWRLEGFAAARGVLWLGFYGEGVYRSSDGAAAWGPASPPWKVTALAALPDGRVLVGTADGDLWRRDARDEGWERLEPSADGITAIAADAAGPVYVLYGWDRITRSDDGGDSWSRVPMGSPSVRAIAVSAAGDLYAAGGSAGLYRSRDGGASWSLLSAALEQEPGGAVAWEGIFIGPRDELYVRGSGVVFASTDGGTTWNEEEVFWPLFVDREGWIFSEPDGLMRRAEGVWQPIGWKVVELTCPPEGRVTRPGFLFSTHGAFCSRAGGSPVSVVGNLSPFVVHDLALAGDGTVWAATYQGHYRAAPGELWRRVDDLGETDRSDDEGAGWRTADLPEIEAWHRYTSHGVEIAFPTYGRPAFLGRHGLANFQAAALEPAGDGFRRLEKGHFGLWIWEEKDVPAVSLTPEVLAPLCEATPPLVAVREGVFQCRPILDGDAVYDLLWAFEDAGRRAILTIYTHQLDREVRDRIRDSVRLVGQDPN